jgi:hypothetical protein
MSRNCGSITNEAQKILGEKNAARPILVDHKFTALKEEARGSFQNSHLLLCST